MADAIEPHSDRAPAGSLYTTVDAAERRGLSRAVDALAEPLSNMSAIVAQ